MKVLMEEYGTVIMYCASALIILGIVSGIFAVFNNIATLFLQGNIGG